ncbi:MAG TPA: hypothetical protein VFP58_06940, partial [Candidatus Eisenbacteria bacterium]|nr:hypothetical protein [Candidatus Eisenbacteria bacterium]
MRPALVGLAWILAISASVATHLGHPPFAQAQPPAESDTTYTPPVPPPSSSRVTSRVQRTGEERDRVELGAAVPRGDFDFLGTFGYRRFVREGGPFE